MKELYICFTPYHILLSSCVASSSNADDKEIIIRESFADAKKIINGLKHWERNPFKRHVMIKGEFSVKEIPDKSLLNVFKSNSTVNLEKYSIDTLKKIYEDVNFDRVYTCNDGKAQSQLLQYICKKNNGTNIYIEDGSEVYNDSYLPSFPLHESLFYNLYFGKWYDRISVLGDYKYTDEIRVLKPELVREELKHKKIKPINLDNFLNLKTTGLTGAILGEFDIGLPLDEEYTILFLPHSFFTKEKGLFQFYKKIHSMLTDDDRKIILKYHPREKNHYLGRGNNNVIVLPQSLPSEVLILQMIDNPPVVIGDISTCLLTSKFLKNEIQVISLINIIDMESKNLKKVFKKIGILMPNTKAELIEILETI